MTSNKQVVSIRSQRIAPCMTCPICNKLFKNATTITECLHTFCRKCIHDKITEEELDSCPVCNVYLGCAPLEKLRADHSLQDLRAAIFGSLGRRRESKEPKAGSFNTPLPATKEEPKEPEVVPPVPPLPARRKEKSLSSLVNFPPPKASNSISAAGRKKSAARKVTSSRGPTLTIDKPDKEEENCPERSSSPPVMTRSRIALSKKQNFLVGESSKQHIPSNCIEDPIGPLEGMTDLWKPLNCLVEAAGITKPSKSSLQGPVGKSAPSNPGEDESLLTKKKFKERAYNKLKIHGADEGGSNPLPDCSVKPKNIHGGRQKSAAANSGGLNIAAQAVVNAARTTCHERVHPIWISLVASDAQNANLTVSFIQKYIVQKLDLNNEAEVEITMQGQPVLPTMRLQNLMDRWLETAPKCDEIKTSVGNSAKDFVLVLCYGRKAHYPSLLNHI
ncbi:RING-type E3 ubiquitin transferase [Sarracenia purpurea var. burkii]